MGAIRTDISYVQCSDPPGVYHNYWEYLCNELFAQSTLGLAAEGTFPDVAIWNEGITLENNTSPYTFTITVDDEEVPAAADIILYERRFYIIGTVQAGDTEGEYTCSGCITIDASILAAYTALVQLNQSVAAAEEQRAGVIAEMQAEIDAMEPLMVEGELDAELGVFYASEITQEDLVAAFIAGRTVVCYDSSSEFFETIIAFDDQEGELHTKNWSVSGHI